MNKEFRVLLTGGGTGGHIYPLLAVADYLKVARLRYFGDPGRYENFLTSRGIEISSVASSKLRRYFSPLNFLDIFRFFFGFIQSLWKLYWFMPDAAFSKGGPGALPVLLACRFYFIPIVIHESDVVPGLTNRFTARYAKRVDIAFEQARGYFNTKAQIETVGQPVRPEILKETPKDEARKGFNFNPSQPVLLFLGGSQGSGPLNDFVLGNLPALLDKFQILHQVGSENYAEYKKEYEFISREYSPVLKARYFYAPYFDKEMTDAFNAADLVVSRAGAGAIFEVAAKGKPAILIPFPESANGHQQANAFEYQKTGAATVIEQENLLPALFISVSENLLKDPNKLNQMSVAARAFYKPDAAQKIADHLLQFGLKS